VVGLLAMLLFITSLLFTFEEVVFGILFLSLGVMINSLNKISRKWVLNTGLLISGIVIWYLGAFLPGIWIFSGGLILSLFYHWKERNAQLVAGIIPAILLCAAFSFSSQYLFNNVLKPHQQDRINVWLQPEKCDPRGSLYNVLQSKVAIGSGGLQGKGYLEGTMTKLNYVPEQSTDFIFSTIGEEQGFIGALGIIGLFLALMLRIILIGERTTTRMYRHFAYAVAGFFFIHTFVNIGMTMGLVPIMGIPLPLISKGGSSLLAFSIMLGILLRMDRTGR
jgi:rod shape determining protein RodA